jgi:hypothetical protein
MFPIEKQTAQWGRQMDQGNSTAPEQRSGHPGTENASPLANIALKTLTEYFEFLDDLRESGVPNMYGSAAYLVRAFKTERDKAPAVVGAWMKTFDGVTDAAARAVKSLQADRSAV